MYPGLLAAHPDARQVDRRVPLQDPGRGPRQRRRSSATRGCSTPGTAAARATCGTSATAGTRRTARPRTTCRATSPSPPGSTTSPPRTPPGCASRGWPVLKGIAEFWAGRATAQRRRQLLRSRTSPVPTSTATASTTASSPTPAPPPRCGTPTRAAAILGETGPGRLDDDRRQAAHPLRQQEQGLPAVRRLQGHDHQAGRHRAADVPAGVADVQTQARPTRWTTTPAHTDPDGPAMTDSVHAIDAAADRRARLLHATPI